MKQWVVAAGLCLGALLVAGTVVVASAQDDEPEASLTAVATGDDGSAGRGERERGGPGDGYGPPPWVRGGEWPPPWAGRKADKPGKPSKQWHQGWRDLSEQERDELMADLAREHATGMRRWAECVGAAEGGADRDACERPVPPGLAKKDKAP